MAIRNNDNTFALLLLLLSVQSELSCERPQRHSGECLQPNERRRFRFGCIAAEEVKTQLQFNLNDVNFVVSWPGNGVKSLGVAIVEDFALHSGMKDRNAECKSNKTHTQSVSL